MSRSLNFSDGFESATASTANTLPAADVTNTPSGNLAATDVQAALNELQTDVDTRVTSALTSAHILVGNVSNVATDVAMSGDIAITNAGVTSYSGTVPLNKGGTGQTTKAPAFDALSPMTTSGDLIYGGASGTGTRLAKGSDGQALVLASGIPSWGTVATNPMTTGGDVIYGGGSGAPTRLANGSNGQYLRSNGTTVAPSWQTAPTASYDITNLGLATSVAANALTITLTQFDGNTPNSGNGLVTVGFRNPTLSNGQYSQGFAQSATTLVVSSGSTLGLASGIASYLFVYAINNSSTIELAVSATRHDDGVLLTSVAEGGAGAADSNTVIYSTTARSNVAMRLIGRILITEATAGTWASNATAISLVPFDNIAVALKAQTASVISIVTTTIVNYGTKIHDTHNTYDATTGTFTTPVAGKYRVSAKILFATAAYTVGDLIRLLIYKNAGSVAQQYTVAQTTTSIYLGVSCYTEVDLAVGDTIKIYATNGRGSTNLSGTAVENELTISFIGR